MSTFDRDREVTTFGERRKTIDRQGLLNFSGIVIISALLGMLAFALWVLLFHDLPPGNKDVVIMIIGMLLAKIGTVVDFHYGGTEQSRKLTDTISTQANTAQAAQAVVTAAVAPPGDVTLQPGDKVEVKAEEKP